MDFILQISPLVWANEILLCGVVFGVFWFWDHKTHMEIWKKDISDGELRTHRMILYSSYGLMVCLILFRWFSIEVLPFFLGFWFTRTVHEFMDELHWHLPRCSEKETLIHLVMWIFIHTGTAVTFIWGYFTQFKGLESLPLFYHIGFISLFLVYSYIGHHEAVGYKSRN